MATGYTAGVQDGTVTDFKEFAWTCARAFGALVSMRDAPLDAEIPESLKPNTSYQDRRIAEAKAELLRLEAMTDEERETAAQEDWERHVAECAKINAQRTQERMRYNAMLTQAKAWEPPTSTHTGLKEFMIQQLEDSIKFDCSLRSVGEQPSPATWWLQQVDAATHSLSHNMRTREEEIQRARERTAWLRHLRASLESMP